MPCPFVPGRELHCGGGWAPSRPCRHAPRHDVASTPKFLLRGTELAFSRSVEGRGAKQGPEPELAGGGDSSRPNLPLTPEAGWVPGLTA